MSKIELSPASINPYVTRLMSNGILLGQGQTSPSTASLLTGSSVTGINEAYSVIRIMKGVMPVDFTTLTDFTSRDTDTLIRFNTFTQARTAVNNFGPSVANVNPATIQTDYVKALATGTATWFWWTVSEQGGNALYHQIIGTTGIAGSGEDLEIPDTNVIADLAYRITNLKLLFPVSWTY